MSRTVPFAIVIVVALIGGTVWLMHYRARLTPELVSSLPAEECEGLFFESYGHAYPPDTVGAICRKHGVIRGPFFALKGKRATRFVPHEFHGVHGTLETVTADQNVVYFYRYDKRYFWIVNAP